MQRGENDGSERSEEQDVAEFERSGERGLQKQVGARSGFLPLTGSVRLLFSIMLTVSYS